MHLVNSVPGLHRLNTYTVPAVNYIPTIPEQLDHPHVLRDITDQLDLELCLSEFVTGNEHRSALWMIQLFTGEVNSSLANSCVHKCILHPIIN